MQLKTREKATLSYKAGRTACATLSKSRDLRSLSLALSCSLEDSKCYVTNPTRRLQQQGQPQRGTSSFLDLD